MMGSSHSRSGACAVAVLGVGVAATLGPGAFHNAPLVLLAAGLVVGGSVAPDLDHPSASEARAFGPGTWLVATVVQALSKLAYGVTRGERDPKGRRAHRTLTHSALGCLIFGAGLAALCCWHTGRFATPGAIGVGLVVGMGVYAITGPAPDWKNRRDRPRSHRARGRRRRVKRWLTRDQWKWTTALGTGGLYLATPALSHGLAPWFLGAALALGMAVHCGGDALTDVGIPWSWPLLRDGKRWGHRHLTPEWLRFTTEHTGERIAVAVMTTATVGLCLAVLTAPAWWPRATT